MASTAGGPGALQRFSRRMAGQALPPAVALGLALLLWEAFVAVTRMPPYLLPPPSAILGRLGQDPLALLGHARVTLVEALVGLALGSAVGLSLGVLMAHSRFVERLVYPMAVAVRSTPFIAIAPLFILWFGFTLMPKAIVAALATFFPMLVNAITGLRSVDPTTLEFFQSLRASRWEVFLHLRVPNALPYFFASLRLCVGLSLIGAVVGELVGAREGLGYVIENAAINLLTSTVFSAVILLTLMGVILTELVAVLESRVLFWHESQRGKT